MAYQPGPGSPPTAQWTPATQQWTPAEAGPAPRRGTPRWLLVAGAATTAVLAVAAFLTVLLWPAGGAAPLAFQPFERTGTVALDGDTDVVRARVAGDRTYFAADRGGELVVVAADRTGTIHWDQPADAVTTLRTMSVTPNAVLLHGDAAGVGPSQWIVALDPATGVELWRRDFQTGDGWRIFTDMIVYSDLERDQLLGLDPGSGEEVWRQDRPADQDFLVTPVLNDDDLAGRSRLGDTHDVPRHGDRVVVVSEDGSAQAVSVESGTVLSQGPTVGTINDLWFGYGDLLFVASAAEGRVSRFDLTDLSAPPDILYTSADSGWTPEYLVTCGEQHVCLLENTGGGTEVVALDTDGGGEVWRHPAPGAWLLLPLGEEVLVGTDEPAVVVYDQDGQEVFARPGLAVRLNAGNVLLYANDVGSIPANLSVAGVSLASGSADRHELGQVPDVRGDGCAWDERYLACPTGEGAGIWQFASD